MFDFGSGMSNPASAQAGGNGIGNPSSPLGANAKQSAAEAMQFQLWVSQQAHNLSKLKVFHDMAKKVNDS